MKFKRVTLILILLFYCFSLLKVDVPQVKATPENSLFLWLNESYYYVKGDTITVKGFSNVSIDATLTVFWNWKSFLDNELVYNNTQVLNYTWNLPTVNQRVGFYIFRLTTTNYTVQTYRTLIHFTDYSVSSLPFSYEWKNINYTLRGRVFSAFRLGNSINISYPRIPFQHRTRFYLNNMTFLVRLDNQTQGWSVDLCYMLTHRGVKWVINGTLDNPVTFEFQINYNPLKRWKKHLDSLRGEGNLVFDFNDLRKAKHVFSYNATSKILSVNIPSSFSIDPEYFSDGFESGDFSAWHTTGGVSPQVTSGNAHHGTYKAVFNALYEMCRWNHSDPAALTECYGRCYIRVDTMPSTSGHDVSLNQIGRIGSWPAIQSRLYYNGSDVQWGFQYRDNFAQYVVYSEQQMNPSVDTWYCVEVYANVSNSDAGYRMWVDGSELTDIAQGGKSQGYELDGWSNGLIVMDYTVELWTDCNIFHSDYIGVETVGPQEYDEEFSETFLVSDSLNVFREQQSIFSETILIAGTLISLKELSRTQQETILFDDSSFIWREGYYGFSETFLIGDVLSTAFEGLQEFAEYMSETLLIGDVLVTTGEYLFEYIEFIQRIRFIDVQTQSYQFISQWYYLFAELFYSTEVWAYLGVILFIALGFFLTKTVKWVGVFWIIGEILMITAYITKQPVTYAMHSLILFAGIVFNVVAITDKM